MCSVFRFKAPGFLPSQTCNHAEIGTDVGGNKIGFGGNSL